MGKPVTTPAKRIIDKLYPHGRTIDLLALRHTFGTRLVANGVDIKTSQSRMRHSTASLTLSIYVHKDSQRMAAARIDAVKFNPSSEYNAATLVGMHACRSSTFELYGCSSDRHESSWCSLKILCDLCSARHRENLSTGCDQAINWAENFQKCVRMLLIGRTGKWLGRHIALKSENHYRAGKSKSHHRQRGVGCP
jgi:hypothetical protein